MEYNKDFIYALGWNPTSLKVMGVWPKSESGIITKHKAWVYGFAIFVVIYAPQSASMFVIWGDMDGVIECLSVNGPLLLAMLKVLIFRYNRQVLAVMVDMMIEDWETPRRDDERHAMLNTAKISRKISIASTLLTNTLFVAYIIFRIWVGLEMSKRTDLDSRLSIGLPHPAYFPYDTKKIEYFIPTWIAQCITTFFCMTSYAVFDTFISAMMLHICGQLRVVGLSLKNLVNETNYDDPKAFLTVFTSIIKRHEKLNQLSEIIENAFNKVLLLQMLICTLTFCFQGFSIIGSLTGSSFGEISILEFLFSIVYVIYTSLHLFVYCYVGDCLLYESTYISQSFYESYWYKLPFRQAKLFMFVGHRSQRALKLTGGKFCTFSINLFITVLKTSAGYLSMLLAVKQRKTVNTLE